MPQKAAGMRTDPPMSVPSAKGTAPVATATADPPEEPPLVRSGFHGFRVIPQRGLVVKLEKANSDENGACRLQAPNAQGRLGRHPMFPCPGTQRRHIARRRREVLCREGNPVQRPGRLPPCNSPVGLARGFQRLFLANERKMIEGRVQSLGAMD